MSSVAVAQLSPREMDAAIETLMPIMRREARAHMRKLPANFDLDELLQACRLGAWEALRNFDGVGSIEARAVVVARARMTDYVRSMTPHARSSERVTMVNDDELIDGLADGAAGTALDRIEAAQAYETAMAGMPRKSRAVVERVLAGESQQSVAAGLGVSASRVCQMIGEGVNSKKRNRTPDTFDPASVPLRMGVPVPPVEAKRRNKYKELADATPAGGSRVLGIVQARSFVSQLKKMKIRHSFRISESGTTAEVWREPSDEQLKGG